MNHVDKVIFRIMVKVPGSPYHITSLLCWETTKWSVIQNTKQLIGSNETCDLVAIAETDILAAYHPLLQSQTM